MEDFQFTRGENNAMSTTAGTEKKATIIIICEWIKMTLVISNI